MRQPEELWMNTQVVHVPRACFFEPTDQEPTPTSVCSSLAVGTALRSLGNALVENRGFCRGKCPANSIGSHIDSASSVAWYETSLTVTVHRGGFTSIKVGIYWTAAAAFRRPWGAGTMYIAYNIKHIVYNI